MQRILLKALEDPSPVSIRINRSKWNRNPVDSEPVPWCKNGFYLENRPSYTLDPLFHSGCYYPQEASGMFLEQAILQTIDSLKTSGYWISVQLPEEKALISRILLVRTIC